MDYGFGFHWVVRQLKWTVILAVVYGVIVTRPVIRSSALYHGREIKMTKGRLKRAGIIYLKFCLMYVLILIVGYGLLIWYLGD